MAKKYVLNFDRNAKALDGEDMLDQNFNPIHIGQFFAQRLYQVSIDGKQPLIKLDDWAHRIYRKETLELDDADFVLLRDFKDHVPMPTGLAVQVKKAFDHAAAQAKDE